MEPRPPGPTAGLSACSDTEKPFPEALVAPFRQTPQQRERSRIARLTAGVCAFSLTSRITQRDGTTGRDAPGSGTLLYPDDPGPHRPAPP